MAPSRTVPVGRYTVRERVFEIERTEWTNSTGLSFDIRDVQTGALLTRESLDEAPSSADIAEVLDWLSTELEDGSLDTLFFDETQLRTILRRWDGAYGSCLRCNREAGPDFHLAGAGGLSASSDNRVVCDDCWDERLR